MHVFTADTCTITKGYIFLNLQITTCCPLIASPCTGSLWNIIKQHLLFCLVFPSEPLSIICMILKQSWNKLFFNTLENWDRRVNSTFCLTMRQDLYREIKMMTWQRLCLMKKEILLALYCSGPILEQCWGEVHS